MSGFNTLINIFICEDSIDGIFTAIYILMRRILIILFLKHILM